MALSIAPICQRVSQHLSCINSYSSNPWMTRQYKEASSIASCDQQDLLKIKITVEVLHYSFFPVCVCTKYLLVKFLSRKIFLKHWEAWYVRLNLRLYLDINLKGLKWWHAPRTRHQTVLLYQEHWTKTWPRTPEKHYWQKSVLSGFQADCYKLRKQVQFFFKDYSLGRY